MPWKMIRESKDHRVEFVLEADQNKLKETENFDRNNWPKINQEWYEKSYAQYNLKPQKNAKLVRMSTARGADLYNQQGKRSATSRMC